METQETLTVRDSLGVSDEAMVRTHYKGSGGG